MKRLGIISWVVLSIIFLCSVSPISVRVHADSPELYIREINITGNEFLALQANSSIPHLSNYWIGYINDNTGLATPSQQLPDIALNPDQVIILSSNPTEVCDASYVAKLSFSSFNNSKGAVALWEQSNISFTQIENITWGAAANPSPSIIIATEGNAFTNAVWYNDGTESWVVGDLQSCSLNNAIRQDHSLLSSTIEWPTGGNPPAVIVSLAHQAGNSDGLPSGDIGLKAPQINELLPNPAGTGNDSTDEFIELYNPNDVSFDLSNFILETGLTTKHKFTFGSGTKIPPKGFAAFYSSVTHLSLSNTSGQATLLDPSGDTISQSDAYGSAKDGQSWALANGNWYWTSTPTPGTANKVNQTAGTSSTSSGATQAGGAVQGASTGANASSGSGNNSQAATPVHTGTLVGVGAAAVLYACYEYRNDLANHFYRLRRYVQARRTAGK